MTKHSVLYVHVQYLRLWNSTWLDDKRPLATPSAEDVLDENVLHGFLANEVLPETTDGTKTVTNRAERKGMSFEVMS